MPWPLAMTSGPSLSCFLRFVKGWSWYAMSRLAREARPDVVMAVASFPSRWPGPRAMDSAQGPARPGGGNYTAGREADGGSRAARARSGRRRSPDRLRGLHHELARLRGHRDPEAPIVEARVRVLLLPWRISASASTMRVLPVPVGPSSRNTPAGRFCRCYSGPALFRYPARVVTAPG